MANSRLAVSVGNLAKVSRMNGTKGSAIDRLEWCRTRGRPAWMSTRDTVV